MNKQTLEEDKKLLENWEKTFVRNREIMSEISRCLFIKDLLAAQDRVVRSECADKVYNCPHQYWDKISDGLCYADWKCENCGLKLEDYSHKDFVSTIQ